MAIYRQVHTTFWQDSFVLDLTPEEKYFYIYLMTNSKTTQCGIYEIPKRIMETETGYNRETIDKLLQRFIEYGKIKYNESTKEIMMVNWVKYNFINSPKVKACIAKELNNIKYKPFVETFHKVCIGYGYGIDRPSIDLGEEEEQEEEQEEEYKKNKIKYASYVSMYPSEYQKLIDKLGEPKTLDMIESLELWKGSKGKKTKSDYLTILSWVKKEQKEKESSKEKSTRSKQVEDSAEEFRKKYGF